MRRHHNTRQVLTKWNLERLKSMRPSLKTKYRIRKGTYRYLPANPTLHVPPNTTDRGGSGEGMIGRGAKEGVGEGEEEEKRKKGKRQG